MLQRLLILSVLLPAAGSSSLNADEYRLIPQDRPTDAFSGGTIPRSAMVIDDAALRDAACVGKQCWVAGDHGVLLKSTDAGDTWTAGILPFECSLYSICFLTSQIGFVAGLAPDPYSGTDQGVLLITRDGGETWHDVSPDTRLPGLRYVRFFGFRQGVVVTTPTEEAGGTILITRDGGQTWKKLSSDARSSDWVDADFLSLSEGVIVGSRLSWGLVNNDRLQTLGYPRQTLQAVRSVSLSEDGRAWLAGDGGFIRHSTNRGVSWKAPASRFPAAIRDVYSFQTVVHDGDRVCVGGTPASCVLCSDDSGATWTLVPCAERGSIHRLIRTGPDSLLAIGSWGMLLKSGDFGRSWQLVRNANRRSSLLYLVTNPEDAAPLMLARVAAEEGYRVSVVQPSPQLRQPARQEHWQTCLSRLGTSSFSTDWRFPRTRPLDGLSRSGLLRSWHESSDGRLRDLLPLRLAMQIRTWQPSVICVESAEPDDAVAGIWESVMDYASAIADGTDPRSTQLDDAGLLPWSPQRIVRRTHEHSSSLEYQADTLLPRLQTTAALVADAWYRVHAENAVARPNSVAYQLHSDDSSNQSPRTLFHGIAISPGSSGRRPLLPLDPGFETLQETVDSHRTQKTAVAGHVQRRPLDTSLIAYTQSIGSSLPHAMALEQLQHMLSLFRQRENLECQIAVQQELIRRFPNSPDAAQAADELHLLYSSAELLTLRERDRPTRDTEQPDPALELTDGGRPSLEAVQIDGLPQPGITAKPWVMSGIGTSFDSVIPVQTTEEQALDEHWNAQAEFAWKELMRLSPAAAGSARHLLIQAARLRRLQQPGRERSLLASAAAATEPQRLLAANEIQTTFNSMEPVLPDFKLPRGVERPQLDGVLSDVCWQHAPEIQLTDQQPGNQLDDGLILISWDDEFLFLAGRLPLASAEPTPDEAFDRQHDEAETTGDHITFELDVDRDYSSSWKFVIDSAGRTSDSCWQITRWNPEWFVATERDRTGWSFEAAIPVEELQQQPLAAGDRWAARIRRQVPGFADQQVELAEAARELQDSWSILRFIRNRRPQE